MATKPIFDDVPAWPDRGPGLAPRDHNKPPLEELIPVEFREELLADHPDFLTRLDQLLGVAATDDAEATPGSVHRAVCTDDETLGRCGSLANLLRKCEQHVEATHRTVKEPYLTGGRLVDAQKNALVGRIITGRQIVEGLQQAYARERQRIANEERAKADAERQRIEAERQRLEELARENNIEPAALPPMPEYVPEPARAAPIRSDDGATVSLGTEWCSQVEDYAKAFRAVKDDAKVREAIDAAIKRTVKATKGQKPIPGVRIWEDVKIGNR